MFKRFFDKLMEAREQKELKQNRAVREAWVDRNAAWVQERGYHGTTTVARNEEQMVKALTTLGSLPPSLQQKFEVVVSGKPGLILIAAKDYESSGVFRKKLGYN